MAKGLTTAPLDIVVADEWFQHPKVLELMSQGHRVYSWSRMPAGLKPDLVLAVWAHAWSEAFFDGYLPAAITAARRRRRETK